MKDPAILFYYKDFDADTASWNASSVGYYIRLLCQQAAVGHIPSEIEDIAQIARVKFSDYAAFQADWKNHISAKFRSHTVRICDPICDPKCDPSCEAIVLRNRKLSEVVNKRKTYAAANKRKYVYAMLGNAIKYGSFTEDQKAEIKQNFDIDAFLALEKEKVKNAISSHISRICDPLCDSICVSLINVNANANANEDVNRNKSTSTTKSNLESLTKREIQLIDESSEDETEPKTQETFEVKAMRWLMSEKEYIPSSYDHKHLKSIRNKLRLVSKTTSVDADELLSAFQWMINNLDKFSLSNFQMSYIDKYFNKVLSGAKKTAQGSGGSQNKQVEAEIEQSVKDFLRG